jgi:hypothetical protein
VQSRRALLVAGFLSAAIYSLLAGRLPWWRYGEALQKWAELLGSDGATCAICLGGVGILMALYVWGLRCVRAGGADRWTVWVFAILFALVLLWLLPITSDLFAYLSRAHMLTDLGANPMLQAPIDIPDPFLRSYPTVYDTRPTVYGPAWVLLSAVGTMGTHDVPMGLLYLKGLAILAYLGSAWLVERILLELRPDLALEGLYLFTWNPLVLLMAVGDGHNDMVMMALALLSIWLLVRQRWTPAFGALALSVWIKYVSLILLPLFAIYAWRYLVRDRRKARLRPLARGWLAAAAVSLVLVTPLSPPEGLAAAAMRLLHPLNWRVGAGDLPAAVLAVGLFLFSIAYVYLLVRFWRGSGSFQELVDAGFMALLLAFLLGAARSQPWHLLWPATLAGLSGNRRMQAVVVGLSGLMLAVQVGVEWAVPGFGFQVD